MSRMLGTFLSLRANRPCACGACKALQPLSKLEARLTRDVHGVLRRQGAAVTDAVRDSFGGTVLQVTEHVVDTVRSREWVGEMMTATRPTINRMIEDGGIRGARVVGTQFNAANPEVQRFVDTQTTRLAEDVAQGTTTRVSELLDSHMREGSSVNQITRDLREQGFSRHRAEAIARTESARASSGGQIESWRQAPFTVTKRWKASVGACQFCDALEIKYGTKGIPLDQPFLRVGESLAGTEGGMFMNTYGDVMGPALHPNCTCVVAPDWERTPDDSDDSED